MSRFGTTLVAIGLVALAAGAAWAGSSSSPPGGGGGGSGPEPEVFALILFSLLPGVFFARRALAVRREAEES
jgi:hypothetical protein